MGHDGLVRLVAPPAEPVEARGEWTVVESALGVRLPDDYKWLVENYGWGEFCDFLYLRTPFGTNPYNGVEWQSGRPSGANDGLLIWGTTMDADRLCWLTAGEPRDWPVVVWDRDGDYETFAPGAVDFVESWAGGRLDSRLLVGMEPHLAPWFNTFRPRVDRCLRLSQGPRPHPERLRILRAALAPTADRGTWRSEDDESGQDHFATVDSGWLLTYDVSRPHQIRVGFPPEDGERVQQRLFAAVRLMECEVLEITTADGTTVPAWETATKVERPA